MHFSRIHSLLFYNLKRNQKEFSWWAAERRQVEETNIKMEIFQMDVKTSKQIFSSEFRVKLKRGRGKRNVSHTKLIPCYFSSFFTIIINMKIFLAENIKYLLLETLVKANLVIYEYIWYLSFFSLPKGVTNLMLQDHETNQTWMKLIRFDICSDCVYNKITWKLDALEFLFNFILSCCSHCIINIQLWGS